MTSRPIADDDTQAPAEDAAAPEPTTTDDPEAAAPVGADPDAAGLAGADRDTAAPVGADPDAAGPVGADLDAAGAAGADPGGSSVGSGPAVGDGAPALDRRFTRRRVVGMAIWTSAFLVGLFAVGLPTDPVYAFCWLWAATIAWNSDRPWRSHLRFARDWVALVVMLVIYNASRGLAGQDVQPHITEMIHADTWMFGWLTGGEIPTLWLQQHLYNPIHIQWYDALVSLVYFSHFVGTLTVAVILWLRSRPVWAAWVRRWFTLTALGLATYFLYPAAPPWFAYPTSPPWLGGLVLPDQVHRISTRGWEVIGLHCAGNLLNAAQVNASNLIAAMPSLHAAYSLLIVAFFLPKVRKRWWPLLLAYPLAMAFTLVYSGEHYMIDVLMGWLYVAFTLVVVRLGERGWAAYRRGRSERAGLAQEVAGGQEAS